MINVSSLWSAFLSVLLVNSFVSFEQKVASSGIGSSTMADVDANS